MGRPTGGKRRSKEDVQEAMVAKRLGLRRPEPWRSRAAKTNAVKATQSVVRAILAKEPNPLKLQLLGIFPGWFHNNLSEYVRGGQAMDQPHRLEIVLRGYKQKFLSRDQLRDLGCIVLADDESMAGAIDVAVDKYAKARERAKRTFDNGVDRLLKGFMPVKARPIGAVGRASAIPRAPRHAAEMEGNYTSWVAKIEKLGGRVTTDTWTPAWYEAFEAAEQKSIEDAWDAQWAAMSEWQREIEEAHLEQLLCDPWADEDEAGRNGVCQSAPIPAWHPYKVRRLKLWFGGREWSPWPRAIEDDWWAPVGGDDWSEFLDGHDTRLEARYLAAIEIEKARTVSPPGGPGALPN
ncbi:hypothetical protein [Paraburkholderia acidiphila]|uniref:Uncharacterized protein n=1 Tax=Paraburkholderia acidiphila TaxID=2571747 RepID=A0A7Z2G4Z2_9BURK|nr:hypothetical protein [Paraburkholderia acidiphila]QGZ55112.1 hypothetical protein FAZ97_09375 [Paraburkholderia acidiphila]